jgi:hypothetical protein
MSANSHGYTLCDDHQDEDLSSIEKRMFIRGYGNGTIDFVN